MNRLLTENLLVDGWRIACGRHGGGTPVVLLHGTPSSSFIWRKIAPALVEAGHAVHLYDLLGFGQSERPTDPSVDTSVSAQTPLLANLFDQWDIERAHVVAHDIGGAIAMRFALASQTRVASLTLIDTVSFDSWPSPRTRQQMQEGLERLINTTDQEHRAHFRQWLLSAVVNQERLEAEALETYLELISGPVGQASFFQHQVRHYDPRHTSELTPQLGQLAQLPVQILWGEDDAWQVIDWAHRLRAAIPGSALHILPSCGHFAMEDQPQAVTKHILDFIKGLAS